MRTYRDRADAWSLRIDYPEPIDCHEAPVVSSDNPATLVPAPPHAGPDGRRLRRRHVHDHVDQVVHVVAVAVRAEAALAVLARQRVQLVLSRAGLTVEPQRADATDAGHHAIP